MARNRAIGLNGQMPWRLSADLRFFKRTTSGHVVVMGRKTFESIGHPLPGRHNIVLTSGPPIPGVETVASPDAVPRHMPDGREIFVIGGAQLYAALLPECDAVYLTRIDRETPGDTFLPEFESGFPGRTLIESGPEYEIWLLRRHA